MLNNINILNFLRFILSIENINDKKVITILGIKIKTKQNKIKQLMHKVDTLIYLQDKYFNQLSSTILLSSYPGNSIEEASKKLYENYPKPTGFLADVQACNLKLMKDLKALCDELDIKFWLHAGTLIGQLRHQGFIPWDDDVDLAMTRKDFNILKENLETNNRLQLCEYYNELTCSRQYQLKYRNADIPIFIDIVMYDECSAKTKEELHAFRVLYKNTRAELLDKFINKLNRPQIIDIGYYKVGLYEGKTKKDVDEIIDFANKKLSSKDKIEEPSYFYSIQNYPFNYPVMLHSDLFPLQLVRFEDTVFYIPFKSNLYLKGYENIYTPPVDIGKTPHIYAFEDKKEQIKTFIREKN